MFSLAYNLENNIIFDGAEYEIDLSFDNVLRVMDMLEDNEINQFRKITLGLEMLLDVQLSIDLQKQIELLNEIITTHIYSDSLETTEKLDRNGDPLPQKKAKKEKQVYSLKYDAEYIFSSFKQAYNIDLIDAQGSLHWQKFKALLAGLPDDTKFRQVLEIRQRKLPRGKGSQEERKALKQLKELYALPRQEGEEDE